MSQTPLQSAVESVSTCCIGYVSSVYLQVVVLPVFDICLNLPDNLALGLLFYIIAIGRGYLVRRYFNRRSGGSHQSRGQSSIEVCTNYAIGYVTTVLSLFVLYPLFGIQAAIGSKLSISGIFYVVAIGRGYVLRRFFNWLWP